jgi:hypothetical protein
MNRWIIAAIALMATGCASKLETGYQPRVLGASDEARRGYYAQPFTPQAKAAKDNEHDFGGTDVRPNMGRY